MGSNRPLGQSHRRDIMTINTPDANLYNEGDGRSAIDIGVLDAGATVARSAV